MTDDGFDALCDLADALFLWTMRCPPGVDTEALLALVERLTRDVEPLAVQLQLEYLIGRLERLIDDTIGLTAAMPPDQADTLTRCGDPCPVCLKDDCTHWQWLGAEEHR